MPGRLVIFDFDKTLVARDSFRLFSMKMAGGPVARLRMLGLAALCRFGVLTNAGYKASVLRSVWVSRSAGERTGEVRTFLAQLRTLELPAVVDRLKQHVEHGDRVAVISASPTFYLEPFVAEWGPEIAVCGAHVIEEGRTVRVAGAYGKEKVAHAERLIREARPESVHVYTDHVSDLPLLKLADRVTAVNPDRRFLRTLEREGIAFEIVRT